MKKLTSFILIVVFTCIRLTSLAQNCNLCDSTLPINNGLVACYPFAGSLNDRSGNSIHGSSSSPVLYTTDRFGIANKALSVDDTTKFVTITNTAFQVNQFTYSAWVNLPNPPTSTISVLSIGNVLQDQAILVTPTSGFGLASYNSDGTYASSLIVGNSPSINTWNHVVMVRNANTVSLYVNGTFIKSVSVSGKTAGYGTSNITAFIGRRSGNIPQYFKGKIDDVRIYNRALSQNEITQLYGLPNDTLAVTISSSKQLCLGDSVQLNASGGTSYVWTPSSGLSNSNIANPIAKPLSTTTYFVTVSTGTCSKTDSVTVTVDMPITVNTGVDNSICLGDSIPLFATGAQFYEWIPSIGLSNPLVANPKASPQKTTDYIVKGRTGGCRAQDTIRISVCVCTTKIYDTITVYTYDTIRIAVTDTLIIDIVSGISPTSGILNTIRIYPNPAHDIVIIDNGNYSSISGYSLKIVNTLGQAVFNSLMNQQNLTVTKTSLGGVGTYFIQVWDTTDHLVETRKLIIR